MSNSDRSTRGLCNESLLTKTTLAVDASRNTNMKQRDRERKKERKKREERQKEKIQNRKKLKHLKVPN